MTALDFSLRLNDKIKQETGIEEGAELLSPLFLKIKEIDINGQKYEVNSKKIEAETVKIGYRQQLNQYQFEILWMALNQKDFQTYTQLKIEEEKTVCWIGYLSEIF